MKVLKYLLIFGIQSCISQTLVADYIYQNKSTIPINKHEQTIEIINLEAINTVNFSLIHSNNKSIFYSSDNTSFIKEEYQDQLGVKKNLDKFLVSNFTSVIYKDFENNMFLNREYISQKPYIIEDTLIDYDWDITDKEKEILGMKCYLAKTKDIYGYDISAWFTLNLPITNGPSIYHKLPGLIIEVHSDYFNFLLKDLKIIDSITSIVFEEEGTAINQEDFLNLYNDIYKKMKIKATGF